MNSGNNITEIFKSKPPEWRIAAVLHDGSWYGFDKWRKAAKVKPDELQKYIDEHLADGTLIKSDEGDSYRVSYDEIVKWYEDEQLDITDRIVPRIYPPRLWGGMTETEAFINVPRRQVGTVSFDADSPELLAKCKKALLGVAIVRQDKKSRYRAFGLSHVYIKQMLAKSLTEEEMQSLEVKSRSVLLQRELTDMPEAFVEGALQFYASYARNALKSKMSTLRIYLPEDEDIQAQITCWVISAIKKFDETKNVPFSGYLTQVLNYWPYDLPDEFLGKELSEFQRKKQRAIDAINQGAKAARTDIPHSKLATQMGISLEEFTILEDQHRAWISERNAGSLTWADSANEKAGHHVGDPQHKDERDLRITNALSVAVLLAAIDTNLFNDAYSVISQIDLEDPNATELSELEEKFVDSFAKHFLELKREIVENE